MKKQIADLLADISRSCTNCGICQEECAFLQEFQIEPGELAEQILQEGVNNLDISLLYSCNLCGICKEVCPEEIDLSKLFLLLREERVKTGKESLPALEWVKERQDWINKGHFLYSKCDLKEGECENVFFPGCTLSGYNPHLGKENLMKTLQAIISQMKKIGASQIFTACPNCYRIFNDYLPQYKLSTVYEIMEREGLPKTGKNHKERFFLFHSCATKGEKVIQRTVRTLIEKMGYSVLESEGPEPPKIRCCGMGGMVGLTNPVLASIIGNERTEEISHDIVTYCAACREALVQYRPSLHILDLVFNPKWREDKENPPLDDSQMRKNLAWLKSRLEKG